MRPGRRIFRRDSRVVESCLLSPLAHESTPRGRVTQVGEAIDRQVSFEVVQVVADNLVTKVVISWIAMVNCGVERMATHSAFLGSS